MFCIDDVHNQMTRLEWPRVGRLFQTVKPDHFGVPIA
jgi:hypothetical protein